MKTDSDLRRLALVRITSEEGLSQLFRTDNTVIDGVPSDARLVRVQRRPEFHAHDFWFQSSEFDVVPEAGTVPEIPFEIMGQTDVHIGQNHGDRNRDQHAVCEFSTEVFSYLFHEGTTITRGIEPDSVCPTLYHCDDRFVVEAKFRGPQFDDVPKGERGPQYDIEIETGSDGTLSSYID